MCKYQNSLSKRPNNGFQKLTKVHIIGHSNQEGYWNGLKFLRLYGHRAIIFADTIIQKGLQRASNIHGRDNHVQ